MNTGLANMTNMIMDHIYTKEVLENIQRCKQSLNFDGAQTILKCKSGGSSDIFFYPSVKILGGFCQIFKILYQITHVY